VESLMFHVEHSTLTFIEGEYMVLE